MATKKNYELMGYITNLGRYNEGYLIGKYITFPIRKTELQTVLDEIGINEEYEEYFMTDYDGEYPDAVYHLLREYTPITELNKMGLALEKVSNAGVQMQFEAFLECGSDFYASCANAIEGNGIVIPGTGTADLAHYFIEAMGGIDQLPQSTLEEFFDYDTFGRDVRLEYSPDDEMPETAGVFWCGDEYATDDQIGQAIIEECGFDGVRNIEYYFDYEQYGKAIYDEGSFIFAEDGIIDCTDFDNNLGADFEAELTEELESEYGKEECK